MWELQWRPWYWEQEDAEVDAILFDSEVHCDRSVGWQSTHCLARVHLRLQKRNHIHEIDSSSQSFNVQFWCAVSKCAAMPCRSNQTTVMKEPTQVAVEVHSNRQNVQALRSHSNNLFMLSFILRLLNKMKSLQGFETVQNVKVEHCQWDRDWRELKKVKKECHFLWNSSELPLAEYLIFASFRKTWHCWATEC